MRLIIAIGLLFSILGAAEISLETPVGTVKSYYYAMNHADIDLLEKVMVKESFDMTLQVWALSKALNDKAFSQLLKQYGNSVEIDVQVRDAVKEKLQNSPAKTITDLIATPLGGSRCMIRYKENGKDKQLFTSREQKVWKINYKAGRKVD